MGDPLTPPLGWNHAENLTVRAAEGKAISRHCRNRKYRCGAFMTFVYGEDAAEASANGPATLVADCSVAPASHVRVIWPPCATTANQ